MSAGLAMIADEHPEAFVAYAAYVDEVWSAPDLPAGTLELCRLRMAQLLGAVAEMGWRLGSVPPTFESKVARLSLWPTDPSFSALDRACLAFAEQFLMDVQALDDATCEAVSTRVGDAGLTTLAIGVGLAEGLIRAAVVLGAASPDGNLASLQDRAHAPG
jgi:alkylhydroperoxidase family enzyme